MTEEKGGGMTIEQLSKKIDEQAKFTRLVSFTCTLVILGVMLYTVTEIFNNLPALVVMHYMGNLEKIVDEWKLIEATASSRRSGRPPAKTTQ